MPRLPLRILGIFLLLTAIAFGAWAASDHSNLTRSTDAAAQALATADACAKAAPSARGRAVDRPDCRAAALQVGDMTRESDAHRAARTFHAALAGAALVLALIAFVLGRGRSASV